MAVSRSLEREAAVRAVGLGAKAVQRGQRALGCDFEDRATADIAKDWKKDTVEVSPAKRCCPVEVPIAGLHQPGVRVGAVRAVEAVQCGQRALGGHFEHRATALVTGVVSSTKLGCPVEVSIGALDERCNRISAVSLVEINQSGEGLRTRGNRRRGTEYKGDADHFR